MKKPPLFRKVNTTAHGVRHGSGCRYRDKRNTKQERGSERLRQPMHGGARRGLDYTPLFKFLLSKVGRPWNDVHGEAVMRLDRPDPIFWMVALQEHDRRDYVRIGESSYYSGLYVDDAGILRRVNPAMGPSSLTPFCGCCTHTFNGVLFTNPYREPSGPLT